jgi:outer membrane protein TolC
MKKYLITLAIACSLESFVYGQTSFTLRQSVDYAIQNNVTVKNSSIDAQISDSKRKEMVSHSLPQVDVSSQLLHNFNVQKIVLENGVIPAFTNPSLPYGAVIAFQLQLNNVWTTQVTANQVIFDKSLFTGIANASLYSDLATKNIERTKIDVAELVTKAYYGVLVSKKQLDFLDNNIHRVDSLYKETLARFKNGLVRQIAVDRVEVRLNNLKDERDKTEKLVELNTTLLRFQMNTPKDEAIALADTLDENSVINSLVQNPEFDYSQRIEYDILKGQIKLSEAQTKALREGYYPKLNAFATSGYNPAATNIGDIFQSSRYYNYTFVGLDLRIPIFHGSEKKYKVQSHYLEEQKLQNTKQNLEKSIDLQVQQSTISLYNNLESLKIQKRNMELAQENVRITQIENKKGIATNIEVINAEADLKEAQTNYYTTLFNALVAKTDLEKAKGTLLRN